MREYGKIQSAFWTSPDIIKLPDNAKLMAVYLLTCEHSNIIGCFRLPVPYIVEDLSWTDSTVKETLSELFRNGFVRVCEQSKWLWICNFLTFNKPENPNQWKAARKAVKQIPEQFQHKQEFIEYFSKIDPSNQTLSEPLPNPCETVATETETETEESRRKFSDEDFLLAEYMFLQVKSVAPKTKKPNLDKWADVIRLMRERDSLSHDEIKNVFNWANKDEFWSLNILSPSKLRDKFATLDAQASKTGFKNKQKVYNLEDYAE